MLKDIKINNYRLFKEFEIDSLARVNLIVGDNNAGKSSILEGIHLLVSDNVSNSLIHVLDERGEINTEKNSPLTVRPTKWYQISQVFNKRTILPKKTISISSSHGESLLEISLKPTLFSYSEQHSLFDEENIKPNITIYSDEIILRHKRKSIDYPESRLSITEDGMIDLRRSLRSLNRNFHYSLDNSGFLTTSSIGYEKLAQLWDNITLTPKEDKVVEALQILEPRVKRISFTSNKTTNSGILLRVEGENEPIPLGSMGDGMRRILAIVASLVSVEDGTLLVDEIDTGLYHGALVDMWRLVIETAVKQDAQVFATTHSWDCVRAFQQALETTQKPDAGQLIRLEKAGEHIQSVLYSADELNIAIEQGIEVR